MLLLSLLNIGVRRCDFVFRNFTAVFSTYNGSSHKDGYYLRSQVAINPICTHALQVCADSVFMGF